MNMAYQFPGATGDFPKLVKSLAGLPDGEIDYWNDIAVGIYKKRHNYPKSIESYFKDYHWVHLDKPYPSCPKLEGDWEIIERQFITYVKGTCFKINHYRLISCFQKYIEDSDIPSIL
ncbi:MAG: hypothetical protein M3162_01675 [Thermoproteota archaeon]|nr:hypothetical protein [Thermoproteota archaeon]